MNDESFTNANSVKCSTRMPYSRNEEFAVHSSEAILDVITRNHSESCNTDQDKMVVRKEFD